jgi:hypothetical protein
MYKVILVPASCGTATLDVGLLEKNANNMSAQGYELQQVYQTSSAGCSGSKTSAVMIFRKKV